VVAGGRSSGSFGATLVAGRTVGWTAEADAPGPFSDLEFAEAGGTELRHEGGKESLGQAVDRGMIRGSFGGAALRATVIGRGGHLRVPGMR
jgi:hypothetical protein